MESIVLPVSAARGLKRDLATSPRQKKVAKADEGPGIPRGLKLSVRREALPVKYFVDFMAARERVRIRKDVLQEPPSEWYERGEWASLARVRLTNLHREDDRTTRVLRSISRFVFDQTCWRRPDRVGQLLYGRQLVFNYGLWRMFGGTSFAQELGFLNYPQWDAKVHEMVADVAIRLRKGGKYCFTNAYRPPGFMFNCERAFDKDQDEAKMRRVYLKVCRNLVPLYQAAAQIASVAFQTRSWRQTTERIMEVKGFGGAGFMAKELAQDLLQTPLFQDWNEELSVWSYKCQDENTWCPVGPGARKGLNRLRGRQLGHQVDAYDEPTQTFWRAELLDVFEQVRGMWPEQILGISQKPLVLHDVQFMLCEFDKYERMKCGDGPVRPYRR